MKLDRLSVVICAYTEDRWDDLQDAVESAAKQTLPADEMIVVIDHNDGLLRRARAAFPRAVVIANDEPKGLSGARNTGWRTAAGQVVAFLDDDAVAEAGWADALLDPYSSPDVLGVGGRAVPAWDDAQPAWLPDEFLWVVGCSYRGLPEVAAPVRNLIGCNMSVRRDVLEAVGGFDTGLGRTSDRPLGCEETDLCIRAAERFPGCHFIADPAAVVHHRVRLDRTRWSYFRDRCRSEGVSKAWVTRRAGQNAALSSERAHALKVLPAGVLRGLADAFHGDRSGLTRSAAIVAGFAYTTTSYITELRRRPAGEPTPTYEVPTDHSNGFQPILPVIVDLSEPLPLIPPIDNGATRARCLVVHRGDPLGVAEFPLEPEGVSPGRLSEQLLAELGGSIGDALIASGLTHTELPLDEFDGGAMPDPIDADTTVVIATRDRPEQLEVCLRSILDGVVVPARVVVVDNAPSTSTSEDLVRMMAATEPSLHYVREDRPGLAIAHNASLPHIDTAKVLFTDDDVVAHPWWVARMSQALDSGARVTCVTGMIVPLELDTPTQFAIEQHTGLNKGSERRVFDLDLNRPDDPLFPWAAGTLGSGANMGFTTAYLRDAGGFDEALGAGTAALGGDDLAAFYDVIVSGHQLVYEPAAIVSHRHHRDFEGLQRQAYGYGAGLSAHLTRCLLDDPRTLLEMLRRTPKGLRRAIKIVRPGRTTSHPGRTAGIATPSVTTSSVLGMLSGPVRYSRSRRVTAQTRHDESGFSGADPIGLAS